ncbi:MAG: sulfite oxidase, partial [Myxococcaceae bacterium]
MSYLVRTVQPMADHRPVTIKQHPFNAETDPRAMDRPQTPTDAFFIRSNYEQPQLPHDAHTLIVSGAVRAPFQLTVAELKRLPSRSLLVTVECAGNDRTQLRPLPAGEPWSTNALGTARWTGVPLKVLLDRAGLQDGALEILFEAADGDSKGGFVRSLPLEKALHEDTLVAYAMNDAPLGRAHGAPARLIVPGWYGMASVKWLKSIRAITEPFVGHYQTEKYVIDRGEGSEKVPVRAMKVKSFVASPTCSQHTAAGEVRVSGFAWSGEAPIQRVDLAVDGGGTWLPTELGPDQGRWAWRSFSTVVKLSRGRHALRSRAT